MQHVVIVIHLMLVLALIGVVLLQKSEGGGLGIGSTAGFMTSRGTANVLTRATAILAGLFFVTSLLLSILAGMSRQPTSILKGGTAAPTAPATPGAPPPIGGGQGGLLNQLQGYLRERDVDWNADVDAALVQRGHDIERGGKGALWCRCFIDDPRFGLQADGESHRGVVDLRLGRHGFHRPHFEKQRRRARRG